MTRQEFSAREQAGQGPADGPEQDFGLCGASEQRYGRTAVKDRWEWSGEIGAERSTSAGTDRLNHRSHRPPARGGRFNDRSPAQTAVPGKSNVSALNTLERRLASVAGVTTGA